MRGDHAGRPRHALAAAQAVRHLGDVRSRARAPDLAVVERSQPHLRHRRSRRRRHAAATARRTVRGGAMPVQRCQRVRPELARDRAWQAGTRGAVVDGGARCTAAARAARARRVMSTTWRRCASARADCCRHRAIDRRFYAIKANPHPAILRALVTEGFGLECVSQAELDHVFAALPELSPQRVLFTPSFAPRREYEAAFARGVIVTLDNVEALATLAGSVPRPHALAAPRPGPRRRPPREGQDRRRRRQVRPADRALRRLPRPKRASSTSASAACTRTWAAASTTRATGAMCTPHLVGSGRQRRHGRDRSTSAAACRSRTRPTRRISTWRSGARGWTRSRRRIRATVW